MLACEWLSQGGPRFDHPDGVALSGVFIARLFEFGLNSAPCSRAPKGPRIPVSPDSEAPQSGHTGVKTGLGPAFYACWPRLLELGLVPV